MKAHYIRPVKTACAAAAALGIPGAVSFGLDASGMAAIWLKLMLDIARISEHKIDTTFALKVASTAVTGVATYLAGSRIAIYALNFIPGAGTVVAMGVNSTLNAFYTWRMGQAVAELFERGELSGDDALQLGKALVTMLIPLPTRNELSDFVGLIGDEPAA